MALTKEDLGQISEIVNGVVHSVVNDAIKGLPTRDELHTSIHDAVSGLATKDDLEAGLASVRNEIRRVQSMLEEDYSAEAGRVTRISRRLDRTRAELKHHIENTVHPDARSQG